jgi:hypothetical protein
MASTRDDVIRALRKTFPGGDVDQFLKLLDQYGVEAYEPERERVQIAILALSEGDEAKLTHFIDAAKGDYRDVLAWAEHAEEMELDTPEKRRSFREMFEKFGLEVPDGLKE